MASAGFNLNSEYSLGFRLFFDYSRSFTKDWYWSVSYETTRHIGTGLVGLPRGVELLELSHNILSGNIYHKVYFLRNETHLQVGGGAGLVHAYWNQSNRFAPAFNLSAGLHFQVGRNFWITTSAVPVLLPSNRLTYAPLRTDQPSDFVSGTIFNIGFQARL
ncbi:MAG: hypothetical protein ABR574_07710 [Cryomorphaceae bacterium]